MSQDKDGLDPWFDLSPSSCVGPLGVVRSVFVVGDSFVVQYAWLLSAKPLYLPLCSPGLAPCCCTDLDRVAYTLPAAS